VRWKTPWVGCRPEPVCSPGCPANDSQLALTVDDGASVSVVAALARFCTDSATRLTVNGANASWSVNAPAPRPMVDSGQIQTANDTLVTPLPQSHRADR